MMLFDFEGIDPELKVPPFFRWKWGYLYHNNVTENQGLTYYQHYYFLILSKIKSAAATG